MGRVNAPQLSTQDRLVLERGFRLHRFFLKSSRKIKRIRTRLKGKPDKEYYQHEVISELELLSQEGMAGPTRRRGKRQALLCSNRWLAALGKQTGIKFSHFNKNLF